MTRLSPFKYLVKERKWEQGRVIDAKRVRINDKELSIEFFYKELVRLFFIIKVH